MHHRTWALPLIGLVWIGCSNDGEVDSNDANDSAEPTTWPVAVPLSGCSYAHTAALMLGNQTFRVVVDSGSTTTAVAATGCPSCEQWGVPTEYDRSGTDCDETASCVYGSENITWKGDVFKDDASLPGVDPVTLAFVALTEQTDFIYPMTCDSADGTVDNPLEGILGLGPDGILLDGTSSYLSGVVAETDAPDSFALRYCHVGGTLWVGGYDPDQTTAEMAYAELPDDWGYWVDVAAFVLEADDGTSTVIQASDEASELAGLLDSGGPSLILPDPAYQQIIDTVSADPAFAPLFGDVTFWEPGHGGTSIDATPSELDELLPWLGIELSGGVSLSLPPTESYLLWFDQGGGSYGYRSDIYSDSYLNSVSEHSHGDQFLDLGNRVMHTYVVYHDREARRVGFAPATACP